MRQNFDYLMVLPLLSSEMCPFRNNFIENVLYMVLIP